MSTGKDTPTPMIDPPTEFENSTEEKLEIIADRYVVMQMLGQGGMGRVFRAHDNLLNRDVAVKLLNRELEDDYFVRRFQQEARAASQLNHGNILCVLDFGLVSQTQPYLVMEWVDGLTLDQILERSGPFPIKQALEICIKLTEGMQHAHRNGIIHRDLKPSNIMLSGSELGERVLILDFGIAKMVDAKESGMLTMTGHIIGSPRCISPEQARGEPLDGRSDIYSLGCVMFEMFTGKPPYRGDTAITTISMHLNEPIPSITDVSKTKFPEGLEEIIGKSMAKTPDQRFASMEELRTQLADLDPETSEEPPIDLSPKSSGLARDTRQLRLIGLLLAVAAGILGLFAIQSNTHNTADQEIAFRSPPKPDDKLEEHSMHAGDVEFTGDDSEVESVFRSKLKGARGLDEADMVIVNSAKSGADLKKALEARPKAFHLRMYDLTITPDMVAVIESTPGLKELRMQSVVIPPELQLRICKMKRLTTLKFVDMPVSVVDLKQMSKLPKLIDLQIYKGTLKDDGLNEISKMTNLQVLEINDNREKFSKQGLKHLAALKNLKKLQLHSAGLDDSDLSCLCTLKNLELLALSGDGPFTPRGLRQLAVLEKLNVLYLNNTKMNDKCLLSISRIPNLLTLDLTQNPDVTIGGLQHLRGRPQLQVVVARTGIERKNIQSLSEALKIKLFESRPTSTSSSSSAIDFFMSTK